MTNHPWVIDAYDIVHRRYCALILESATPYGSLAKTSQDMIEMLARPDVCNGHSAPSFLAPCVQCLEGRDDE